MNAPGSFYNRAVKLSNLLLTGLSTATNAVIAATDTALVALGKLQAQITGIFGETQIQSLAIPVGMTGLTCRVDRNCTYQQVFIDPQDLTGITQTAGGFVLTGYINGVLQFTSGTITTAATYNFADFNASAGDSLRLSVTNTTGVTGVIVCGMQRIRR